MAQLVDLSHEIAAGLVTYPGLPAPVVTDFLTRDASEARYAPGVTFHIARIVIDATARTGRAIDVDAFAGRDVRGKAVLVRTGWDVHWATPRYADGHPFLRMPWSPE